MGGRQLHTMIGQLERLIALLVEVRAEQRRLILMLSAPEDQPAFPTTPGEHDPDDTAEG